MATRFYEYDQENSGGHFHVDDKVCPIVMIEANSADESNTFAMGLGIYFDGCFKGIDCKCCGDRWTEADKPFDLESFNDSGIYVFTFERAEGKIEAENRWYEDFGAYEIIEKPKWFSGNNTSRYSRDSFKGKIKLRSLEEYLQFEVSNLVRWSSPSVNDIYIARVYYLNDNIKEIRPR